MGFSMTRMVRVPVAASKLVLTSENRPVAIQRLQRLVDIGGVVIVAFAQLDIGQHRARLDALGARAPRCAG